jgi:integrase
VPDGLRYRNALTLIVATGMRRGEVLALHWSDIDLDVGVLVILGLLAGSVASW